jgi:hypothetical protein
MSQVNVQLGTHKFAIDADKTYDCKVQKESSGSYRVSIIVDEPGLHHPAYMYNVDSREKADSLGTRLLEAVAKARFKS